MGRRKNDGRNEGHNAHPDVLNGTAQQQLRSVIERVERTNAEIAEITEFRKDIFAEAKSNGFDVKIIRKLIQLRARDAGVVAEEEAILDLYRSAVGMTGTFEAEEDEELA